MVGRSDATEKAELDSSGAGGYSCQQRPSLHGPGGAAREAQQRSRRGAGQRSMSLQKSGKRPRSNKQKAKVRDTWKQEAEIHPGN